MQWIFFAFFASLVNACVIHLNHHFKVDGLVISVFKNLSAFILMLFAAPFVNWDLGADFYLALVLVSFISVFVDVGIFNAAAKYGSRLTSMYMTVRILGGFIAWLLLSSSAFNDLISQPLTAVGVIFFLVLSCVAIFMLRNHDASWRAFLAVAPPGLLLMIIDVIVKSIMEGQPLFDAAVVSATVIFGCTSMFASGALYWRDRKVIEHVYNPHVRTLCLSLGILFCFMITSLNSAMATTPNPAYVNAVLLTSIVWLMIYHKLMKIPDDGNPVIAGLFLISAIGIVLLTS